MIVATHNLMRGLRLPALLDHYAALRREVGLDVLCVQENDGADGAVHSARIAATLGAHYDQLSDARFPRLGIVYDRARFAVERVELVALPRLARLSWFERLYIVGGTTRQKYAQIATLRARAGGEPFAVANFHLDTAGTNAHRRSQIAAVADALTRAGLATRAAACGDTNAFAWRRQLEALRELLGPLAEHGATDPDSAPTHFFARQREPKLMHRLGVMVGKLGIDLPRRYDVVCASLPAERRGQIATRDSDHDLVWADLRG